MKDLTEKQIEEKYSLGKVSLSSAIGLAQKLTKSKLYATLRSLIKIQARKEHQS